MELPVLRLEVDGYEIEELRSYLSSDYLQEDRTKPKEALGDPVTVAVIILAPLAIKALAAWLTKQRRKSEIVIESEIVHPDNTREHKTVRINLTSSTTEPDVLRQLKDQFNLDPQLVKAAERESHTGTRA